MKVRNEQAGEVNFLLISLIFASILFLASLGFGVWAFAERQNYKNNSDKITAAAVEVARQETAAQKDNEYLEKEKNPLKSYQLPADLGAISLKYPKTWSGYVSTDNDNSFIFSPNVINGDNETPYALEINVSDQSYNDIIGQYSNEVESGNLKAKAYNLPKVPSVDGVRFDGQTSDGKSGSVIVLPLRDKSIIISCQIPDNLKDFNKIILPNLSFNP